MQTLTQVKCQWCGGEVLEEPEEKVIQLVFEFTGKYISNSEAEKLLEIGKNEGLRLRKAK